MPPSYTEMALIITSVTGFVGSMLGLATYMRTGRMESASQNRDKVIQEVKVSVDGKLADLTTALRAQSRLEGEKVGIADERARQESTPNIVPP